MKEREERDELAKDQKRKAKKIRTNAASLNIDDKEESDEYLIDSAERNRRI